MKETTFSVRPATTSLIPSSEIQPIAGDINDKPVSYATLSGLAQRMGSGDEWQTDQQFFELLKVAGESKQFVGNFNAINEAIFGSEKELVTAHTLQQRMAAQHLSELQLENIRGFILQQYAASASTDIAAGNRSLVTQFLQTFTASELPVLQEYRKQGFNSTSLNIGRLAELLNSPDLVPEQSVPVGAAETQSTDNPPRYIMLTDAVRNVLMDVGAGAAALMQALMTSWDALQHYPSYAEIGQDINQVITALTAAAGGLVSARSLLNPVTGEVIESASKQKLIADAVAVLLASGKAAPGQEAELRAEVEKALKSATEDMVAEIGQLSDTAMKGLKTELSGQLKQASAETNKGADLAERMAVKLSRMANNDGAKPEKEAINTLAGGIELAAIGLKDAGKILDKVGKVTESPNDLLRRADEFIIKLGDAITQNPSSSRLKLDAWANRLVFGDTAKELAAVGRSVADAMVNNVAKPLSKMPKTLAKVLNDPPTMAKLDKKTQPLMDDLAEKVAKPLTKMTNKLGERTDGLLHLAAGGVSKADIKLSQLHHSVAQIAEPKSHADKVADNAIRSASLRLLGNTQKIKDLSGKLLAAAKEAKKLKELSTQQVKQAENALMSVNGAAKVGRGEAGLRAVLETAAESRQKAAPKKKSSEEIAAALKEQAAAALKMAEDVLSQADEATLISESNAALDNVPLHLRKQTESRLDTAIKPLKQTVLQLKAAAEMLKQAAQMAEQGPDKAKEASVTALRAMQHADIAKREIKTTLANVTGSPLHNFTLDGRTAQGLGECADETIKEYQQAFPDIDAGEIKKAMAQVLQGIIGLEFTKEKDPDGVLMAKRVELALENAQNGTMVWPPTPDEILNQTPATREYIEELGVKKLTGMGVLAAGAKAFIPELLSRMFGFDPKLSGVMGLVRGVLSPLEVYCEKNRIMQGVKPGEPRPDAQMTEIEKRLYARAAIRIANYLLPRPIGMGVAAAATASGYYRAEDHGAFIKKAAKRAVLQEVPFAAINLGTRAGTKAAAKARAEAKAAPAVHKIQDMINASLTSEHKSAQISALMDGLEAGTLSDTEYLILHTELKKMGVSDADLAALDNSAPDSVRAGRTKRGLFSSLGTSLITPEKKPIAKPEIVTEFRVQQAKNELEEISTELAATEAKKASLLRTLNAWEGVFAREAEIRPIRAELAVVENKIITLKENVALLQAGVKSLQDKFDASEMKRKSWDSVETTELVQKDMQLYNDGGIIRMSDRLNPTKFIRNYLEKLLKKFPKADCGGLVSPDSEITIKGMGSNSAGGTRKITLMDLAMGRVAMTDWDIKWEKNVSMALREALNPGGSNKVPEGGGTNLGTNWYSSTKTRPDTLTVQLMQAYKKSIDEIRNNPKELAALSRFHDSTFKFCADEIKANPALKKLFNKDIPAELKAYKAFLQKLDDIHSGNESGHQLSFQGHVLTDVIAVRVDSKILAFDISGDFVLINETESGLKNKDMQEWVIRRLDANSQFEYRTAERRDGGFHIDSDDLDLNYYDPVSPLKLTPLTSLGEGMSKIALQRAEDDMNSLVKTSREYLSEKGIELLFKFVGTGAAIALGMAGGAAGIPGLYITLAQIAMAGKLTVAEALMLRVLADAQQEKEAHLTSIPVKLLTTFIIEGGLGLGMPLAKQMMPALKVPWGVPVKDINPVKEGVINTLSDSASGGVTPMATELVNKIRQQPKIVNSKTQTEPLKPLKPKTPEASKSQLPKLQPERAEPVIIGTIGSQAEVVTYQKYVVNKGDNFYSIMLAQGVPAKNWQQILDANSDVLKIFTDVAPGQVLIIPDDFRVPIDRTYVTREGDSLLDLCYRHYGFYNGWNYLSLANAQHGGVNPDNLPAGLEFRFPNSLYNGSFTLPDFKHTVMPGQTMADIAYLYYDHRFGYPNLDGANPGVKQPLVPGTVLNISKYVYPKYFEFKERFFDVYKGLVKEEPVSPQQESPAINHAGRTGGFFGNVNDDANENLHVRSRINPVVPQNKPFVGQKYNVQPGDTFHDIANAFGIRPAQYAEFIALNKDALNSVTALKPGNTLLIPDNIRYVRISIPVESPQAAGIKTDTQQDNAESRSVRRGAVGETNNLLRGRRYTVQQGDTLASIARKHTIPYTKIGLLTQANKGKLLPGNNLEPGTEILIPESALNKKDSLKPEIKHRPYTIQPGDTIHTVVFKFYGNYDKYHDVINDNHYKWPGGKFAPLGVEIMLLKSQYEGNYAVETLEHTVKAGENLKELGYRYYDHGVGEHIISLNNPGVDLKDPLKEGTVLIINDSVEYHHADNHAVQQNDDFSGGPH